MTLHHLRVFIKVAESGSVSAAARECHLAQPTVSQLIKELEEFYAARLFERLSKRLYITEEGRRLLARAKEVEGAYERLEYDMSPDKRRDRLRIGSSVTVGMCLMPSLVRRFGAERPETEIYSYVSNTQTIERMLLGSELDAAVVEGRVRSRDLLSFHCRDDYVALFCSAAHPFAARASVTLGELCREPFVLREKGSGTREIFENFMRDHGQMGGRLFRLDAARRRRGGLYRRRLGPPDRAASQKRRGARNLPRGRRVGQGFLAYLPQG